MEVVGEDCWCTVPIRCTHTCTHVHTLHTPTCMYAHTHMHTHARTHLHAHMQACTSTHGHTHTHMNMHAEARARVHTRMRAHTSNSCWLPFVSSASSEGVFAPSVYMMRLPPSATPRLICRDVVVCSAARVVKPHRPHPRRSSQHEWSEKAEASRQGECVSSPSPLETVRAPKRGQLFPGHHRCHQPNLGRCGKRGRTQSTRQLSSVLGSPRKI